MRTIAGILYRNDGDWVESCTALFECGDVCLAIVRWVDCRSWSMLDRRGDAAAGPTSPLGRAERASTLA